MEVMCLQVCLNVGFSQVVQLQVIETGQYHCAVAERPGKRSWKQSCWFQQLEYTMGSRVHTVHWNADEGRPKCLLFQPWQQCSLSDLLLEDLFLTEKLSVQVVIPDQSMRDIGCSSVLNKDAILAIDVVQSVVKWQINLLKLEMIRGQGWF